MSLHPRPDEIQPLSPAPDAAHVGAKELPSSQAPTPPVQLPALPLAGLLSEQLQDD